MPTSTQNGQVTPAFGPATNFIRAINPEIKKDFDDSHICISVRQLVAVAVIEICMVRHGLCKRKEYANYYIKVIDMSIAYAYSQINQLEKLGLISVERTNNGLVSLICPLGWGLKKLSQVNQEYALKVQELEKGTVSKDSIGAPIIINRISPLPTSTADQDDRINKLEETIALLQNKLSEIESNPIEQKQIEVLVGEGWSYKTGCSVMMYCNWEFDLTAHKLLWVKFSAMKPMSIEELQEANQQIADHIYKHSETYKTSVHPNIKIIKRNVL
mgnify:FL=1